MIGFGELPGNTATIRGELRRAASRPKDGVRLFPPYAIPITAIFIPGQSVSLIGTWTRTAALGWIAFQFTHSEFLLGIVFMLNSLPIFLFAIYAGSLADRIPKIRIFTLTSWFSLLSSLTLAVMLFRGPVHIALSHDLLPRCGDCPPPSRCRPGRR